MRDHMTEHRPAPKPGKRPWLSDTLPSTTTTRDHMAMEEESTEPADPDHEEIGRLTERLNQLPETERAAIVASVRQRLERVDDAIEHGVVSGAPVEGPLSFSQERLWFLDRLEPGSATYNMRVAFRLTGPLDVAVLEHAFAVVQSRHAVLRTRYPDVDGVPRQVVDDAVPLPFKVMEGEDAVEDVDQALADEVLRPFDLSAGPVWRIRLFRTDPDVHVLLIVIHHIAADGWSVPIILREVENAYAAKLEGRSAVLSDLPIQMIDVARRQRERSRTGAHDEGIEYWSRQLARSPSLDLPTDRPRPLVRTSNGGRIDDPVVEVDPRSLADLAAAERTTPSIVWLALFTAFLARYSRSRDVIVGGPSAERDTVEVEPLIGFLVNTLAYRTEVDSASTFRELLRSVRQTALDAYRYRDVPFERVVKASDVERDPSRSPIFQAMFQYDDQVDRPLRLPGVASESIESGKPSSKFDLELEVLVRDEQVTSRLTYNRDLFDPSTATRMMRHFAVLAGHAIDHPDGPLGELPLMTVEETNALVEQFSADSDVSTHDSVLVVMDDWVRRRPDARALSFADRSWSYADLDAHSRRIASRLASVGVCTGDRVAIAMRRSPEAVAAILGVMRCGAAYVPLDVDAPSDRTALILTDAAPAAIIVDEATPLAESDLPTVVVTADDGEGAFVDASPSETVPAYVVYTSGTTGTPKGVVVEHRALIAFATAAADAYGITEGDRLLQFHSLAFDTSVEEIFATLVAGAELVLRTDEMIGSVGRFLDEVTRYEISVLDLPTAFWHVLAAGLIRDEASLPPCVHTVVFGGEAADPELVRQWKKRFDGTVRLINGYGPTETTVTATVAVLSELEDAGETTVTIGRALPSSTAYVIEENGHPAPIGVRGELWIGGTQVARGYLGDPDLTTRRFVPAPLRAHGRAYRTGDLVRWRPDGNLEFLGRIDRQLKLRGFRIEPGEIEAQLVRRNDVSVAFVHLWHTDREPILVAYVVPADGHSPHAAELVSDLRRVLPDYMVPTVVLVDELPRNQSDKVATELLPAPTSIERGEYVAPQGEAMVAMARLWGDVLGVDDVGASDRFFDIGGHSLVAVEMVSRVEREFRTSVPLATVFSHPTLAEFTDRVTNTASGRTTHALVAITQGGSRPPLICLPMMEGSVLSYERLTRHLDPDVPILGPHARGADGLTSPLRSIEDMGLDFASRIMGGVAGPYRLLGASYAGLLALETAKRIVERGGTVELVVLLDSVLPRRDSLLERQRQMLARVRDGGRPGLVRIGRDVWKTTRIRLGRVRHGSRWIVRDMAGRPLPSELAAKRLTHASLRAESTFVPEHYSGAVLYFRASDEDDPFEERRDEPWKDYLTNMTVVDSEGKHWGEGSMLDEPHLTDLCRTLNLHLAHLDRRGSDA